VTRTLTLRQLNRTLLLRQLLLERQRVPLARAVSRLVALQAQYAPSPYLALWSRVDGFRKETLTRALAAGAIVKAASLRTTLHVMTRADFPRIVAAYIDSQRGRIENLGVDIERLRDAVPDEPITAADLFELGHRVLATDDRWTVALACRALPFVRTAPTGAWPHTKPSPLTLWREELPDAGESARSVVRAYLAGYGPASRDDVAQFTGFKLRQIAPALEGLPTYDAEDGRTLFDAPRGPLAAPDADAPVRFLPAFDSIILAHRDRSRILPDAYYDTVLRKANATTLATFTVDGFVAGSWTAEKQRGRTRVAVEPFAPLPPRVRTQVDEERARLSAFYDS
jgi:hypothetical protein